MKTKINVLLITLFLTAGNVWAQSGELGNGLSWGINGQTLLLVSAQENKSAFRAENAIWIQCYGSSSSNGIQHINTYFQISMEGDTVVSGNNWKFLYCSMPYIDDQLWGLIRIDNNKVYYIPTVYGGELLKEEILLYDFDKNPSDSICGAGSGVHGSLVPIPVTNSNIYTVVCVADGDTLYNYNPYDEPDTYIPIFKKGTEWNVLVKYINEDTEEVYYTRSHKLEKDTIIDEREYVNMYVMDNLQRLTWKLMGSIREDSLSQKVFYKAIDDEEKLIYDFGVSFGDTVKLWNINESYEKIAYAKTIECLGENGELTGKSIGLGNMKFENTYDPYRIEKIKMGSVDLLFNFLYPDPSVYNATECELLCVQRNGESLYMNESYDECYMLLVDNEILTDTQPKAKILLANEQLRITFADDASFDVAVYNMRGMLVVQRKGNYGEANISLNRMARGVYFVRVSSGEYVYTQKVVR